MANFDWNSALEIELIGRLTSGDMVLVGGWESFLRRIAPQIANPAFFHKEYWEWYWQALKAKQAGRPFPRGNALFAVWSRSFGKSSNSWLAPVLEAAMLGNGYCLYVSGDQRRANTHLSSIVNILTSDAVKAEYPGLSSPKKGVTGQTKNWRQEFVQT